jgi:hypothetical protein
MSAVGISSEQAKGRATVVHKARVVLEVLLVFAATHFLLKSFKQLSELGGLERSAGLNFSPGLFFGGMAIVAILVCRQGFCHFGLGALRMRRGRPRTGAITFGLMLYLVPLLAFIHFDPKLSHALLSFGGLLMAVSIGEELFFRGYMQTRLNDVLGRPWQIRGIPFGFGLILSTLVFGFLHALNTVDYFHGRYSFDWGWATVTAATGLLFGLVREATGSVWPGVAVHGLLNIWVTALIAHSNAS